MLLAPSISAMTARQSARKAGTTSRQQKRRQQAHAASKKGPPIISAPLVPTVLVTPAGRHKLTKEKLAQFLTALASGFAVSDACDVIGMSREHMYQLRREDEEFGKMWADAMEMGTSALEDLAVRRARSYSDVLLMFLLKARDPARFAGMPRGGTVRLPGDGVGGDGDRPVTFTFDFGSGVTPRQEDD